MRYTVPQNDNQALPFYTLRVQGGTDVNIAFDIVQNEATTSVRRYCNKQLVHQCIPVVESDPLALVRAEFLATDDPCYVYFNMFKSSEDIDDIDATIILEGTEDSGDDPALIDSVIVQFLRTETCCLPLRQFYRLYGYFEDESRILLSHGNLYVTPCSAGSASDPLDYGGDYWTDVNW